jgi:MFS family permease
MRRVHSRFIGLFICLLAALFFLYEFFLRVFISTISIDVMREMHLNAQMFSIMGAAYFFMYDLMQIPVGVLIHRFGMRLLLILAVFFAALGSIWFSFSYGFSQAFFSRLLMGFGSSFAYVCLLVLALNWLPRNHFGFIVGIANLFGVIGPMLAGGPLAFFLKYFNNDWRIVLLGVGIFGLLFAGLIGFVVRDGPVKKENGLIYIDPYTESLRIHLKRLLKNFQVWSIVLYAGMLYSCLPLLGAYWGTAYLQLRGMERVAAASISSCLWLGVAVSAPLLGMISDRIKRRKPILCGCALLGVFASFCIIYMPVVRPSIFAYLFCCIGVASSGTSISFAVMSEHVSRKNHATAIGLNNTLLFFPALIPIITGFLIEESARARYSIGEYILSDFQHGLFLMPLLYSAAFFIAFFVIEETFCRQRLDMIQVKVL